MASSRQNGARVGKPLFKKVEEGHHCLGNLKASDERESPEEKTVSQVQTCRGTNGGIMS